MWYKLRCLFVCRVKSCKRKNDNLRSENLMQRKFQMVKKTQVEGH